MSVIRINYQHDDAPQLFEEALKQAGFVILTHHPIQWDDIQCVYDEWRAFFNSPGRYDYLFDRNTQEGYSPKELSEKAKNARTQDIKEQYQLYFPWGRYPKALSNKTRELFYSLFQLGKELLFWVQANMPERIQEKLCTSLQDMISMERTQFRMLYYPALTGHETPQALRAARHEDINLITLLPSPTTPGLEFLDATGQWQEIATHPGEIIINVGDMLQEATYFHYRAVPHRVINPTNQETNAPRLSMPLFMHPTADIKLSSRYPTANAYLRERLYEIGFIDKVTQS